MYKRLSLRSGNVCRELIEGWDEKVIHAVVQGDENARAVCIKHANTVGSWIG